jgi:amino acid transporter
MPPINATLTLATPTPSPNIPAQNAIGTSLPAAGIVGIVAGLGFLFGGLAWFAYFALVVLPVRKKALLKERWKKREKRRMV